MVDSPTDMRDVTTSSILRALVADLAHWGVRHPVQLVRALLAVPLVALGLVLLGSGLVLHPEEAAP